MSIPGSANPLLLKSAASATYSISRSLRFNAPDSAYLSRTPASAGNRRTWSWAGWVKRSGVGARQYLFSASPVSGAHFEIFFLNSDNKLYVQRDGGGSDENCVTDAAFRDPSAWLHIVISFDATNATAANRCLIYVNGAQQATTNPLGAFNNADYSVNATVEHSIGRLYDGANYFYSDGYLADIHFIDGQALTPTSFGEFDANGIWQPKAFSGGSYGTNGFRLPFSNNASTTTISQDSSGNNNHWTANNISVTAGAGNDSLVDSPTNGTASSGGDAGGVVVGNYATLNALAKGSPITLANGNLDYSETATDAKVLGTIGMSSGKWYWEVTPASGTNPIGIAQQNSSLSAAPGFDANSWCYYSTSGNKYTNSSGSAYGASFTANDVIGVAFDADNGTLAFYKNGASQGTAYTGLTSGPYFPAVGNASSSGTANFGQRPFAYAAPAGFKSLNTANLPTPAILKGSSAMDVVTYTGTGASLTPTSSLGFSPDLVWIKGRSGATDHALYDTVRGVQADLVSNSTAAETTQTTGLTAFNSNGFTVGALAKLNSSAATYAAWCWDAGTSSVTNTANSITSTVRANASAGFSIVTFTGPSSGTFTVGHGLGIAPSMYITKVRNGSGGNWVVYHASLGATKFLSLNSTAAEGADIGYWNNTAPTSTVISLGNYYAQSPTAYNLVVYCFAPVAGFSAFGSYTGNGSATDGPFVYTGFRPRWVLVKRTDAAGCHWTIWDTSRDSSNYAGRSLYANLSNVEDSNAPTGGLQVIDVLSNGFKLRDTGGTSGQVNGSGATYIYCCFAESPFSIARAR